jgi:hypothetical protein
LWGENLTTGLFCQRIFGLKINADLPCNTQAVRYIYTNDSGKAGVRMENKMKNAAAVTLGRLGGQATSKAKTRAARQNAKLGGWPKGKPRIGRKAKAVKT